MLSRTMSSTYFRAKKKKDYPMVLNQPSCSQHAWEVNKSCLALNCKMALRLEQHYKNSWATSFFLILPADLSFSILLVTAALPPPWGGWNRGAIKPFSVLGFVICSSYPLSNRYIFPLSDFCFLPAFYRQIQVAQALREQQGRVFKKGVIQNKSRNSVRGEKMQNWWSSHRSWLRALA